MSEFYGSAQQVPYEGKDVGNFRSTIRRVEKFKDMQETLDRFADLQDQDPDFYFRVKLDEDHKVQNLFWVDSAARRAYIESYHYCVSFDATYMTKCTTCLLLLSLESMVTCIRFSLGVHSSGMRRHLAMCGCLKLSCWQ
jgi:hypothetical protein